MDEFEKLKDRVRLVLKALRKYRKFSVEFLADEVSGLLHERIISDDLRRFEEIEFPDIETFLGICLVLKFPPGLLLHLAENNFAFNYPCDGQLVSDAYCHVNYLIPFDPKLLMMSINTHRVYNGISKKQFRYNARVTIRVNVTKRFLEDLQQGKTKIDFELLFKLAGSVQEPLSLIFISLGSLGYLNSLSKKEVLHTTITLASERLGTGTYSLDTVKQGNRKDLEGFIAFLADSTKP